MASKDAQSNVESMTDLLAALRAENARLVALLEAHGIDWRLPPEPEPSTPISVS